MEFSDEGMTKRRADSSFVGDPGGKRVGDDGVGGVEVQGREKGR